MINLIKFKLNIIRNTLIIVCVFFSIVVSSVAENIFFSTTEDVNIFIIVLAYMLSCILSIFSFDSKDLD